MIDVDMGPTRLTLRRKVMNAIRARALELRRGRSMTLQGTSEGVKRLGLIWMRFIKYVSKVTQKKN